MIEKTPRRPLLRYHGGKWKLAPWIISYFPKHRIYVEPFGGAASVLLQKPRCYSEVYNDLNQEIVSLFRVVREQGSELKEMLAMTPFSRDEYKLSYELTECPIENARRTVVRSFMGFGSNSINRKIQSGFRANSNRSGTTPAHDWRNLPNHLDVIIERLRGVVIENRSALEVMSAHDADNALHYCDPPYPHSTRGESKHHGYEHEMTDGDHADFACVASRMKGAVIVSGYDCELYRDFFGSEWRTVKKKTHADGARDRVEVLWLRNVDIPKDLFQ